MSKVIRVDAEVYSLLLKAKADLEAATGQPRSFNDAVAFLIALGGGQPCQPTGSTASSA
jgi:hypothetical protein